ncbi:MAG: flagellar hook-basal body complex protein FliE [Alicyclobacillus sp.]|nr:flagellar hook-basal body complex protein FliE [Alicyclobacillus sp.]
MAGGITGIPGSVALDGVVNSPVAATSGNQHSGVNPSGPGQGSSFADVLANLWDAANQAMQQADTAAAEYTAGGPVTLDQLMVKEQQASLALDLVVQVRNRVVSAYQSLMNMQI